MTSEGLGEMFEGDSADMCAGKFPLVSMGGWTEDLACADPGERTPIGASGNSYYSCYHVKVKSTPWFGLGWEFGNKTTMKNTKLCTHMQFLHYYYYFSNHEIKSHYWLKVFNHTITYLENELLKNVILKRGPPKSFSLCFICFGC